MHQLKDLVKQSKNMWFLSILGAYLGDLRLLEKLIPFFLGTEVKFHLTHSFISNLLFIIKLFLPKKISSFRYLIYSNFSQWCQDNLVNSILYFFLKSEAKIKNRAPNDCIKIILV